MNNQLAIFILFATLSFFNSKAQTVDSLNTDTLEILTSSVKDSTSLISSISTNDSLKTDSTLSLLDTNITVTDTITTKINNTLQIDSTINRVKPKLLPDSIFIKSDSTINITTITSDSLVDSTQIQKNIVLDSTVIEKDSLKNIPVAIIDTLQTLQDTDSLKLTPQLNSDTILTDSLENRVLIVDSVINKPTIDSLHPLISLDSVQKIILEDSIIDAKAPTTPELLFDSTSKTKIPLIDSLVKTTQTDTLILIDSLLPVDTYDIIEIDTLKSTTKDTLAIALKDSTITNSSIDTIPYQKLTGDALVDSIMNASMIEIQNTPKPKTDKPTPTSLESYSVDDLPSEISFVVHAFDSITKTPIKATVLMSTLDNTGKRNNGTGICNSVGYFSFFLTPHSHFEITVSYPDYIPIVEEIDFTKAPVFTPIIKKEYALKKFQVGDVIHLKDVNFKQGDFHLQREAFPVLDKLAKLMLENPKMVIKLKGHTDNSGSPSANITLSESRITEVRYYLLRKGIKLNRLKGEGYGGGHPLVPNNCPENMQRNRRVEFEVLKI